VIRYSAASLDPQKKPFHKPVELVDLGFGDPKTIYAAIRRATSRP
jgi:hypothetical protein